MPKYFLNAVVCVCLFVFAVSTPCAAQDALDLHGAYWSQHCYYWGVGNDDIPLPDLSELPEPDDYDDTGWKTHVLISDLDLSRRDLRNSHIHLRGGILCNIKFDNANLEGANFSETRLLNCSFRGANLRYTVLPYTNGDMTDAVIGGIVKNLSADQIRSTWNFKNKDFSDTTFYACAFPDIEYDPSFNFTNTTIVWSDRSGANIRKMFKLEDFRWNQLPLIHFENNGGEWHSHDAFRTRDFRQKSLQGSTIRGMDFSGCDFSGFTLGLFENCSFQNANFKDAVILLLSVRGEEDTRKTGFKNCDITKEQIEQSQFWKECNWRGVVLEEMNLDGWNFSDKDLSYASLSGSSVKCANLENVTFYYTDLHTSLSMEQLMQTKSWKEKK